MSLLNPLVAPLHPSALVTLVFLVGLLASACLRLWLAWRQVRHVRRCRDQVPRAFAEQIELADHQKAADYTVAKVRAGVLELLVSLAWLLALTLGGGLELADTWWRAQALPGVWGGVGLIVSVSVLSGLVGLPLSIYATFGIEQRFGFNRTTPGLFVADLLKSTAVILVLGVPLLALMLWLMAVAGTQWWLAAWLVWTGFLLFMTLIAPAWILPLFNRFDPLPDGDLKRRIEALARRCEFGLGGLYVMDGSKRSSHGNAFFTGFGKTRRIALFDTLLERLSVDEAEAVMAHELGHYKHGHIRQTMIWNAVSSLLAFAALAWLLQQTAFFQGLGVSQPSAAVGLLLFAEVLPLLLFPFRPLTSYLSRRNEFQADAFAARHARARDLISGLVKLYRDNASTLTPDPLYVRFYYSHPPASVRVAKLQENAHNA